ncbi:hypothetical protein [Streptomyces achromogenes]|uniref:hypothetical protein n=1 Tax=Streptomyces achromogenes TaxID=67255 RepID=UPI0027D82593|nr:hypothetical protein [Streptomyces achromogenes]
MHLNCVIRWLGRRVLARRTPATRLNAFQDGPHGSIDSALLLGPAFDGPQSQALYGHDREQYPAGEGGDYLASIRHT